MCSNLAAEPVEQAAKTHAHKNEIHTYIMRTHTTNVYKQTRERLNNQAGKQANKQINMDPQVASGENITLIFTRMRRKTKLNKKKH